MGFLKGYMPVKNKSNTILLLFIFISSTFNVTNSPSVENPLLKVSENSKDLVVLVHGFGRTGWDMRFLKQYFSEQGYAEISPTLPTSFRSVEDCARVLASKLKEHEELEKFERVHFVGHSMGGLIIRVFLSENELANQGRCVLIATPNSGTPVGAFVSKYLAPLTWISPAYSYFQPGGACIPPPLNGSKVEIGGIAGNNNDFLFGRFIDEPSDGIVPVESVWFEGMTDFIVLDCHHEEIHFKAETANIVDIFLRTGAFRK